MLQHLLALLFANSQHLWVSELGMSVLQSNADAVNPHLLVASFSVQDLASLMLECCTAACVLCASLGPGQPRTLPLRRYPDKSGKRPRNGVPLSPLATSRVAASGHHKPPSLSFCAAASADGARTLLAQGHVARVPASTFQSIQRCTRPKKGILAPICATTSCQLDAQHRGSCEQQRFSRAGSSPPTGQRQSAAQPAADSCHTRRLSCNFADNLEYSLDF